MNHTSGSIWNEVSRVEAALQAAIKMVSADLKELRENVVVLDHRLSEMNKPASKKTEKKKVQEETS